MPSARPDSSKKNKQQKQVWAAKRNVIMLVSLAAILVLAPIYYFFLWGEDESIPVKSEEVVAARENNSSDELRARKLDLLKARGAIKDTVPSYSSSYDFCTLGQNGKDWVIQSWYQTCSIKSADLFETTLTRSEILERLQLSNEVVSQFGPLRQSVKTCDVLYGNSFKGVVYLDFSVADADKAQVCNDLDFSSESTQSYYREKTIRSYDASTVDMSKKYILVKSQTSYFEQSIGCRKTALKSCAAPLSRPITGF